MTKEIFRKTTGKGAVLVVSLDGQKLSATVDGKAIDATLRYLDKPKAMAGKVLVAQMGAIGLTVEEKDAIELGWRGPAPVASTEHEHAKSYSPDEQAWDRAFARKSGAEEE